MEWLAIFIVAIGLIAFVEWKLNSKHGFTDETGNPFAEVIKKRIITKKRTKRKNAKAGKQVKKTGTSTTVTKKKTKKKVKLGGGNRRK